MEIMIYSNGKVSERYHFKPQELDKIRQFCYNECIKWYIIKYSEKEKLEYEQLSKGHN